MVNFEHDKNDLLEAFNVSDDGHRFLNAMLSYSEDKNNITKTIERIWIDETINDNMRCFAIFAIGRLYQMRKKKHNNAEGGE